MKKLVFVEGQAVANNSGAMETRDHLKNRASSKSQQRRMNIWRRACFGLLVTGIMTCGLLLTGCGGGSSTPSSVTKKALNAWVKGDVDKFIECVYDLSNSHKERVREELKEDELVKFEIQDERIFDNGEKAEVIVKFFFKGDSGDGETDKLKLVKTGSGWKLDKSIF
jgi:hypothetical protein